MSATQNAFDLRDGYKPFRAALPEIDAPLLCLIAVTKIHGLASDPAQLAAACNLDASHVSFSQLVKCAEAAGLTARPCSLDWAKLSKLRKSLPAIVRLKGGGCVVLQSIEGGKDNPTVVLQDSAGGDEAVFSIDRVRFEEAWTGEAFIFGRDYGLGNEDQPFGIPLIAALVFRERRLVRDLAVCSLMLSFFALMPILFIQIIGQRVLYYRQMNTFVVLCLCMGVLILLEAAFAYFRGYVINALTTRIDVRLFEYLFDKVLGLPIDFFERMQVGQIAYDVNQIEKIRLFLTGQLFGTVLDSLTLFFFLPVMLLISPFLTCIVVGLCGLIAMWLILMLPPLRRRAGAVIRAETDRSSFLYQTLAGARTVKSLALETRQRRVWNVLVARSAKARQEEGALTNFVSAVARPIERLAISGTYALGVYIAMTNGDATAAVTLFAFLMLSQRIAQPLLQMAQLVHQYDEARGGLNSVARLVNRPPEDRSGSHGTPAPLEGHIRFSNVRFTYPGSASPALANVSFEAPTGTTLGLVGRSGSGKSTITRLLQRLHSNYEGSVSIDGVDVREHDLRHLRRSLGVVMQENFLFTGTIRENISASKPSASFDEIVRAAQLAGAEEFIDRLPRGYETHIYEGSPNLSGGQRQRLAIARALIVDPRILILDEATSALDPDSEAIVNANIRRIAVGRTVVVVSHRLSSLVNLDAILVLEQGRVLDFGTHSELLVRCEVYSGLWHQQNGHIAAATSAPAFSSGPVRAL